MGARIDKTKGYFGIALTEDREKPKITGRVKAEVALLSFSEAIAALIGENDLSTAVELCRVMKGSLKAAERGIEAASDGQDLVDILQAIARETPG